MTGTPRTIADSYRGLVEESAEDLYENAPCGYLSTLPDGLIVRVNQTFLTWTGFAREEVVALKRFQDLLSVDGQHLHETHCAPLLRRQGFVHESRLELVPREGAPLPVLLHSVLKKDAAGQELLIRTTLFDLSDRRKYEQELLLARRKAEQAAQTKAEFLSMVSHELRTPMNAIVGIASLLEKTELSGAQQKYVRILQSSSENLLGLINNILDFSKLDAGKATLAQKTFDVRQLVYGLLFGLSARAEEKKLSVQAELDEQVPGCLIGDPLKLGQVLTNLVGNALKFTEVGAVTVTVDVRERFPDAVSLDFAVTDTGIGIAPEHLAHIFDEFEQAHDAIGPKYGGTGLGLSISQKLVELQGGRIGVKSTLGRGSSFFFTLRLQVGQEEAAPGDNAKGRARTEALHGLRALVADDNAINVFMLTQFLRRWGMDFDVVEGGDQAVERLHASDYDVVLMDVRMPGLDGFEATRAIRALPGERFRRIPILAVTASSRVELRQRAEEAGFTDVLYKPYKPEELAAKLAMHRDWRRSGPQAFPPGNGPADELAAGSDAAPPYSFERVRRMLNHDVRAFAELSAITRRGFEQYKQAVQEALVTGDREAFAYQAHKLRPTVELLQARTLRAALQQGRDALEEALPAPARREAALQAIHHALDVLIAALREATEKA